MIKKTVNRLRRWLLRPQILRKIEVHGTAPGPRLNKNVKNIRRPLVYKLRTITGANETAETTTSFLKENLGDIRGARFLIKINLNTADPYPASSSPEFVVFLVRLLKELGAGEVLIGDCSSLRSLPTLTVFKNTGLFDAVKGLAKIICFDEDRWVRLKINGFFLKELTLPATLFETDFLIALANLKSHLQADFSFSLKLNVGFMHPLERYAFHRHHLAEKVAELALAVQPDIVIIDARLGMITEGPDSGLIKDTGVVIIGTDQVPADIEAYRVLYGIRSELGLTGILEEDPFTHPLFRHARRLGLQGTSQEGYQLVSF